MRRFLLFPALRNVLLLVCILLLSSCNHHDLTYSSTQRVVLVNVNFDWSNDPTAAPAEMTVYFFRDGAARNSLPIAYDFKGRDGGVIILPVGTYSAICHNADSDRHGFVGQTSFDEFGLRLGDLKNLGDFPSHPSSLPRADGAETERMANSPDSIWVAAIPHLEIAAPLESAQDQMVSFIMQPVVHHYTFIIHNPVNFNSATSIMASVSGMSAIVHPGRGMTGEETVTHAFDMVPTADGGLIGHLLTFGHCGSNPVVSRQMTTPDSGLHSLVVYATLADGRNWYSTYDVTDQIHSSSVPDCVVELDSINLPPSSSGGGFQPTVGGWQGSGEIIGM